MEERIKPVYGKRRMAFVIWNFEGMAQEDFTRTVDAAKEKGFTTIRLHLSWFNAEKQPLRYDFKPYDKQIAYIRAKGMDVILTVDLQRKAHIFDGERTPCDMVLNTDEFQYAYGKNTPFLDHSICDTVMISFASRKGTDYAIRFYSDALRHFVGKFGDTIYAAYPTFTPFCETEYWCTDDFDYSPHMRRAFRAYLARTYRKIKDLNRALGTDYPDFESVPLPPPDDRGTHGMLFYRCRHLVLKDFIDRLAEAHRAVAPHTVFAVQFGCVWDGASVRRCTLGVSSLAESADLVVVDDAPKFDHAFSMDYLAGALSKADAQNASCTEKAIGNEIDGYSMIKNGICTADDYIRQGITTYQHGGTMLFAANWYADESFENNGSLFSAIADACINKTTGRGTDIPDSADTKHPDASAKDAPAEQPSVQGAQKSRHAVITVSTQALFQSGSCEAEQNAYRRARARGVLFPEIRVRDDLLSAALPYSIAAKHEKKKKEPENPASPAVIFRRKAKAAAKATFAVGAAIAIFAAGIAAKIIVSGEDDGDN